jgi:hypothetical protein
MGYTNLKIGVTLVVVANGYGGPGPLPADTIWRDLARAYFGEDR